MAINYSLQIDTELLRILNIKTIKQKFNSLKLSFVLSCIGRPTSNLNVDPKDYFDYFEMLEDFGNAGSCVVHLDSQFLSLIHI